MVGAHLSESEAFGEIGDGRRHIQFGSVRTPSGHRNSESLGSGNVMNRSSREKRPEIHHVDLRRSGVFVKESVWAVRGTWTYSFFPSHFSFPHSDGPKSTF